MAAVDDGPLARRLESAAEQLEFALLRPTTFSALLQAQEADFQLVDDLIAEAVERDPDVTELRVDPSRFSPYFLGGPLGDLETNIEALRSARRAVGELLVELGYAAESPSCGWFD